MRRFLLFATLATLSAASISAQTLPTRWNLSSDGRMLTTGKLANTGVYDSAVIHNVNLTFSQSNYWNLLLANKASKTDLLAGMVVDGTTTYDSIGVRFKGQTSYNTPNKKSFNITMDFVKPAQTYGGYTTLNFNNSYEDPTFLREVFYLHQISRFTPAARANYVHLYLNGADWGLYPNVQQLNKTFLKEWYFSNDGAHFRADAPTTGGPGGGGWGDGTAAINFLGTDTNLYKAYYTLKSSDITQPWDKLRDVCDKLNNSGTNITTILPQYLDIDRTLWFLASEIAFSDDDSYIFKGKMDYYIYYEPESGRMMPHEFDGNSSFYSSGANWGAFYNATNVNYPLLNKILAVPEWRQRYLAHLRTVIAEGLNVAQCTTMVDNYKTQIDALVQSDPKKIYTYAQFNSGITSLKTWIQNRVTNLNANSEVAQVAPTIAYAHYRDAAGALWTAPAPGSPATVNARISSAASGVSAVKLYWSAGLVGGFTAVTMYDDGAHADSVANDGLWGAAIPAQPAGTRVRWYVEAKSSNTAGSMSYLPVGAEHDVYTYLISPTAAVGDVVINELMASNSSTVADGNGQYDDWVELYNRGTSPVNVGGYYLTDNATNLDKWRIPTGTTIPAGSYLTFWADEDSSQGTNHMNFKLSASGEFVYLLNASLSLMDSVTFGTLPTDMSWARSPNGTGPWVIKTATFSANNDGGATGITAASTGAATLTLFPNPARDIVTLQAVGGLAPVEVRGINGALVYQGYVDGAVQISTAAWAPGVYIVRCGSAAARLVVTR